MHKYRKIESWPGSTIESAVEELGKHDDLVCIEFNGKMLYSDIDDLNSAYEKIVGITKAEFDQAQLQKQAEYEREIQEHEEAIPKLTIEWIEKGIDILDKQYHELWTKVVPVRLSDLYRGMELKATLDIVKELNAGCSFEDAKTIIDNQGHSGMSYSLVCAMVQAFCIRGKEFVQHLKDTE